MRRIAGTLVVLVLAAGALAGCSASSGSSSSDAAVGGAPAGGAGVVEGAKDSAPAAETTPRQVVTSGSVSVVVADPAAAAQHASELVESAGGRVEGRVEQSRTDSSQPSAHLVVRIPATALTPTLAQIKKLGKVDNVQLTATDVTEKAQDLDSRIAALTVSVGRLETLMGKASSSTDLIALESALSSRQSDLEAMQAQRTGIAGQVAMATITLDLLATAPPVVAEGPHGFWSALGTGWRSLVAALSAVLIALGVLLPWLLFVGAVTVAIIALTRTVGAHRAARTPPPAQSPAGPTAGELLGGVQGP